MIVRKEIRSGRGEEKKIRILKEVMGLVFKAVEKFWLLPGLKGVENAQKC